jgi:hypothetical protein
MSFLDITVPNKHNVRSWNASPDSYKIYKTCTFIDLHKHDNWSDYHSCVWQDVLQNRDIDHKICNKDGRILYFHLHLDHLFLYVFKDLLQCKVLIQR